MVLEEFRRLLSDSGFQIVARQLESMLAPDLRNLEVPRVAVYVIDAHAARQATGALLGNIPLKRIAQQVTRRMEHDVILKVLQANQWNRRRTAEILKISYRALLYKVRQAGLPSKRPQRRTEIELEELSETQS